LAATHRSNPRPSHSLFHLLTQPPPSPPLFPYTTLFRSRALPRSWPAPAPRPPEGLSPSATSRRSRISRLHKARRHARSRSAAHGDRKSTRLNSSHVKISYAVFCLKKKKKKKTCHFV